MLFKTILCSSVIAIGSAATRKCVQIEASLLQLEAKNNYTFVSTGIFWRTLYYSSTVLSSEYRISGIT